MVKLILLALGFLWPYVLNLSLRVLALLGVGFLTYETVSTTWDYLEQHLTASIGGLPTTVMQLASLAGVGHLVSAALGGLTCRLALSAFGSMKKLVFRTA